MEVLRPNDTLVVCALELNLLLSAVSAVHSIMSSFQVSGQVAIPHGRATLSVVPVQAHTSEAWPRPSPDDILTAVEKGSIQVHPSRLPLKKKDVSNSLSNTQRHLYLTLGALGDWNARAHEHFETMMKMQSPLKTTRATTQRPRILALTLIFPCLLMAGPFRPYVGASSQPSTRQCCTL